MAMFGSSWNDDDPDRKIGPMSSWVNDSNEFEEEESSEISIFSRWKDDKPIPKIKKNRSEIDYFSRWKNKVLFLCK